MPDGFVTVHNGALVTSGSPPVGDTTYAIGRRRRNAKVTVGAVTVGVDYPAELLYQGSSVIDNGPLGAVEGIQTPAGQPVADDWEAWLFLHRAFEGQ